MYLILGEILMILFFSIHSDSVASSKQNGQHEIGKLILANFIRLLACLASLYTYVEFTTPFQYQKFIYEDLNYPTIGIYLFIFGITNAFIDLSVAIYEYVQQRQSKAKLNDPQPWDYINLIINISSFIVFSIFLIIECIPCSNTFRETTQLCNTIQLARIFLLLLVVIGSLLCIAWGPVFVWKLKYRSFCAVLFSSSTILICISIMVLVFTGIIESSESAVTNSNQMQLWYYKTSQISASYTIFLGVVGIILMFMYGKGNLINNFRDKLRYFFNIACLMGIVIILLSIMIHRWNYDMINNESISSNIYSTLHVDIGLSIFRCLLLLLIMKSVWNLTRFNQFDQNELKAERIELSKQSQEYIEHLATAIDTHSQSPDIMTGRGALQLMIAYEQSKLESTSSIILRVTRPNRRTQNVANQFDDTEAIVLLTIVHNYDTTLTVLPQCLWTAILRRILGSENWLPFLRPCVIQLGVLGYQWPFRTSIFLTANHHDKIMQTAEVLRSVTAWNEMQKSDLHCDVILLPTFKTDPITQARSKGGFFPLTLPSTFMIDLRPHHGKTWKEYMKTLKRTNRRPYLQRFLENGGTIEEIHDLDSPETGKMICQQWEHVARYRKERKEPPTFSRPNVEFIQSIGHSMMKPYRSVIFLRFNDEVIASSVILRFPNKLLTSDLHGHTHEKSRPTKAYFVMLQWIVKEALEKKFDFVDFGPTTPGPKMDLGCSHVPLDAGGYCGNPCLNYIIQRIGQRVDDVFVKNGIKHHETHHETHHHNTTHKNSETNRTTRKTTETNHHHGTTNGFCMVRKEEILQKKVKTLPSTSSELNNGHVPISDITNHIEILEDRAKLLDKKTSNSSKVRQEINDIKTFGSNNSNTHSRYNNSGHHTTTTNHPDFIAIDDESMINESHDSLDRVQAFLTNTHNNMQTPLLSLYSLKNLSLSKKSNCNKANNNEFLDNCLSNSHKENALTDCVTSSIALSALNHNIDVS